MYQLGTCLPLVWRSSEWWEGWSLLDLTSSVEYRGYGVKIEELSDINQIICIIFGCSSMETSIYFENLGFFKTMENEKTLTTHERLE